MEHISFHFHLFHHVFSQIVWVAWARHSSIRPVRHCFTWRPGGQPGGLNGRLHRPLLSVTGLTTLGDYGFALGGFSLVYSSSLWCRRMVFFWQIWMKQTQEFLVIFRYMFAASILGGNFGCCNATRFEKWGQY